MIVWSRKVKLERPTSRHMSRLTKLNCKLSHGQRVSFTVTSKAAAVTVLEAAKCYRCDLVYQITMSSTTWKRTEPVWLWLYSYLLTGSNIIHSHHLASCLYVWTPKNKLDQFFISNFPCAFLHSSWPVCHRPPILTKRRICTLLPVKSHQPKLITDSYFEHFRKTRSCRHHQDLLLQTELLEEGVDWRAHHKAIFCGLTRTVSPLGRCRSYRTPSLYNVSAELTFHRTVA